MNVNNLNISEIPWSRIVHSYGRATDYPIWFNHIKNGILEQQENALNNIKMTIEHQDGLTYVTPVFLPFVFELLFSTSDNKKGILEIIESVVIATGFQYNYFEIDKTLPRLSVKELIKEEFLWPEFENENKDELLWEQYTYEPQYWLELTAEILLKEKRNLDQLTCSNIQIRDLKDNIIQRINKLCQTYDL